ncbi:MAG: MotA/TolQ/ExbB proton channel family protein [Gammaproteobacteria bacterium]
MIDRLLWQIGDLRGFLHAGGPVLWSILVLAAVIGFIVAERYWFLFGIFPKRVRSYQDSWQRLRHQQANIARPVRSALISEARIELGQWLPLLKTLVALCPLLGLLGTVTGMIEVFDVVTVSGTGNVRAMAAGISRATLPTMAGMVVALPGLYFCLQLEQRAAWSIERLADRLRVQQDAS